MTIITDNGSVYSKRRNGTTYLCKLPDWWDDKGRLTIIDGFIIIAHPEHQPMRYTDRGWLELEMT